jgi:lipoprotein-releasing system permease protein
MGGVAIGVMALIVVLSVMNGFNDQIRQKLFAVEPHLVVTSSESTERLEHLPLIDELRHRPGVQAEVFENQDVILRTVDGLFGGAVAHGVEKNTLEYILRETHKAVEAPKTSDSSIETPPIATESADLGPGEVLIGIDLARSLGIFEGDKITVVSPEALLLPAGEAPRFERVVVKGLLQTNIADIDAKAVYFRRGQTFAVLGESASREVGFEVRLPDPWKYEPLKKELEGKGFKVSTWVDRNSALFYALRLERFAIGTFLGLAALIASFSIITVLVLLLTQKRKDIGLLMALGLSPAKARRLFMGVGLMLSAIGIGIGVALGVSICLVVDNNRLPLLPDVYYDTTIPARVDPLFVCMVVVAAGVVALQSAYIPARTHTAELPSELLKSRRQNHGAHP